MTKLAWGLPGAKRYETGVDQGVLYLPNGQAVPWNGLTSVTDDTGGVVVEEYWLDGVKYLTTRSPGDYGGTLKALTYPDEFLPFDGFGEYDDGVWASNQPVQDVFGLSYRTRVGNDQSADAGYKIHVLYNLTAAPDTKTYPTMGNSVSGEEFSWTLSGVPVAVVGLRPTCHFIFDSTDVTPGTMAFIEAQLYGTATATAALPDAQTLVNLQQSLNPSV